MEVSQNIDALEKMYKDLMDKLPADKQKLVRESIDVMSKATTTEELARLQDEEIEKLKHGS